MDHVAKDNNNDPWTSDINLERARGHEVLVGQLAGFSPSPLLHGESPPT